MVRRCSICKNEGHNSRTCNVRSDRSDISSNGEGGSTRDDRLRPGLDPTLGTTSSSLHAQSSQPPESALAVPIGTSASGSNDGQQVATAKGDRWSTEEHMRFLSGLQILGKGQWKAMSKVYVKSRTPNQISSHAQKYFHRANLPSERKRNHSIFDIVRDDGDVIEPVSQPDHPSPCPSPQQQGLETRQTETVTLDLLSNFVGIAEDSPDEDDASNDEATATNTPETQGSS